MSEQIYWAIIGSKWICHRSRSAGNFENFFFGDKGTKSNKFKFKLYQKDRSLIKELKFDICGVTVYVHLPVHVSNF